MDERRIEQALRHGPPDEPAYVPGVAARLASDRRDFSEGVPPPTTHEPEGPPDLEVLRPSGVRVRRTGSTRRRSVPLGIAAALAIAVGGLLVAQMAFTGPTAVPTPSADQRVHLESPRPIRIGISNGAGRPAPASGSYVGYGRAVADAVAGRLSRASEVSELAAEEFGSAEWDLLLPGGSGVALPGAAISDPYAFWPTWLAAGPASSVTDLASLVSARVCVVRDSVGARWLAGDMAGPGSGPPAGAIAVDVSSDDACIAAVAEGRADALLTAMLVADLPSRGLHLVVPTPVVLEPWTVVIRPGADAATLVEGVNEAIGWMRGSGRLDALISDSGWLGQIRSYTRRPS